MTTVRTLFPTDPPPPNLARESDPQTSHDAAAQVELGECHATVMDVLNDGFVELTARRIGTLSERTNPKHEADTYRRRMHELVRMGLVEVCGTVKDETTGRNASLYRRTKQ